MRLNYFFLLLLFPFVFVCCHSGADDTLHIPKHTVKVTPAATTVKMPGALVDSFDAFVHKIMTETNLPGAAIAIVKDSGILLLKGYGVKTYGSTDSVNVHTVFRIASVSKGFASTLAGILVQENLIHWDDKVRKYLPKFSLKNPTNSQNLTIRHILSHTSGLPVHTFTSMIEDDIPYSKLRDELNTVESTGPVGTIFAYQNVIYSLIADITEAATHKSYETLLHEKVFTPLGMSDASASYKDIMDAKNVAMPHLRRGTGYVTIKNTPEYYAVLPAAGVNASISDMAKWMLALLGNREDVITASTLSDIFAPEIKTPRQRKYEFFRWPQMKEASYALGWRVLKYGGRTVIYHGGHVNGYRSEVAICPATKTGIAILTNSTGKLANDGVEVFLDECFEGGL